jgi:predicted ATPase
MSQLPAGTVTLLFTDVEGSTRLLQENPDRYGELLQAHRRVLREVVATHGGTEVDTQGDALFAVFTRAADAAAAAVQAQTALAEGPVRVRMGIHVGEPLVSNGEYVGIDVHRAARIAAAAHGGQVVISETARRLLADFSVHELGEHRLKDLTVPERLYQLGDGDFPPLRTLDASNLPVAASPLLGRERELGELVRLLRNGTRLVTITGPGGTGKTRLALQVAGELVGAFRDGIFWVPLAGLSDPDLVMPEIAQAVGAHDDVLAYAAGKEIVLVLDNFEHLLDAAPALAPLVAASERLRVLATSRAPLRLAGELEYPLEPLPPSDAVTLFVERARGAGRTVARDASVEAICRRLDGLPLAIELAAARTKLLAPDTLLQRLDRALPMLTGGTRDAPERQRTLRATIEWSYDLLDEECKALFRRLAIFAGGFSLQAAEDVCDAGLDALASLVDLNLVKAVGDDRFLMLDTIREYAGERLGEADSVHGRHAAFYEGLARASYDARVEEEAESSATLETEHDNLRAALDWLARHDPAREVELAAALGWFWVAHSHLDEGVRRLEVVLAQEQAPQRDRARALTALGALAGFRGTAEGARAALEEAIELWRELAQPSEEASALDALGWALVFAGDEDSALGAFEASVDLYHDAGDRAGERRALIGVGQVLVMQHALDRAESLSRDLLEQARASGDRRSEQRAAHYLADCALIRGDCSEAERRYRESLKAAIRLGDAVETSFEVEGVAMALAGQGESQRGLVLAAAAEALRESLGVTFSIAFWQELQARYFGGARTRLGCEADTAWQRGRELPFADAVALALGEAGS